MAGLFSGLPSPAARRSFGSLADARTTMRFSLIDLLIVTACFALGCVAVAFVFHFLGYASPTQARLEILGVPVGGIIFLALTPPIYRHLRLLPLFIPRCPHCKRLPGGYHITEARWPRQVIVCSLCQKPTELWWRKPALTDVSKTMPSVVLSWPESIGRWRLISRGGISAA